MTPIEPTPHNIAFKYGAQYMESVRRRGFDAFRVTDPGEVLLGQRYKTEMVLLIKKSKPFKVYSLEEFVEKF